MARHPMLWIALLIVLVANGSRVDAQLKDQHIPAGYLENLMRDLWQQDHHVEPPSVKVIHKKGDHHYQIDDAVIVQSIDEAANSPPTGSNSQQQPNSDHSGYYLEDGSPLSNSALNLLISQLKQNIKQQQQAGKYPVAQQQPYYPHRPGFYWPNNNNQQAQQDEHSGFYLEDGSPISSIELNKLINELRQQIKEQKQSSSKYPSPRPIQQKPYYYPGFYNQHYYARPNSAYYFQNRVQPGHQFGYYPYYYQQPNYYQNQYQSPYYYSQRWGRA